MKDLESDKYESSIEGESEIAVNMLHVVVK